jgi:hypothetical protein
MNRPGARGRVPDRTCYDEPSGRLRAAATVPLVSRHACAEWHRLRGLSNPRLSSCQLAYSDPEPVAEDRRVTSAARQVSAPWPWAARPPAVPVDPVGRWKAMTLTLARAGLIGVAWMRGTGSALEGVCGEPCAGDDQHPPQTGRKPDAGDARTENCGRDHVRTRPPSADGSRTPVWTPDPSCPSPCHGLRVARTEGRGHGREGAFAPGRGPTRKRASAGMRRPPHARMGGPVPAHATRCRQ